MASDLARSDPVADPRCPVRPIRDCLRPARFPAWIVSFRRAKRGANRCTHRAATGYVRRSSSQLSGMSGGAGRCRAMACWCLLSSRSQVRVLPGAPNYTGQHGFSILRLEGSPPGEPNAEPAAPVIAGRHQAMPCDCAARRAARQAMWGGAGLLSAAAILIGGQVPSTGRPAEGAMSRLCRFLRPADGNRAEPAAAALVVTVAAAHGNTDWEPAPGRQGEADNRSLPGAGGRPPPPGGGG